jgi:hypothetical protein
MTEDNAKSSAVLLTVNEFSVLMGRRVLTQVASNFDFTDKKALPSRAEPPPNSYPYVYVCGNCHSEIFGSDKFLSEAKFVCFQCGAGLAAPKEPT